MNENAIGNRVNLQAKWLKAADKSGFIQEV